MCWLAAASLFFLFGKPKSAKKEISKIPDYEILDS